MSRERERNAETNEVKHTDVNMANEKWNSSTRKKIYLSTRCACSILWRIKGWKINSSYFNIIFFDKFWCNNKRFFKIKFTNLWKYFSSQAIELAKREWVASQGLIGKLCSATEKKKFFPSHSTIWNPFLTCLQITRGKQKARHRRRRRKLNLQPFQPKSQ